MEYGRAKETARWKRTIETDNSFGRRTMTTIKTLAILLLYTADKMPPNTFERWRTLTTTKG